jgi:hypothetical protein
MVGRIGRISGHGERHVQRYQVRLLQRLVRADVFNFLQAGREPFAVAHLHEPANGGRKAVVFVGRVVTEVP